MTIVVRIKPDPPVREDGLCVVCGGPREPNRSRKYGLNEAQVDPFCSTVCCKAWHQTDVENGRFGP